MTQKQVTIIKKGLDLPISGSPSKKITDTPIISTVAILSNDFVGMKPTLIKREGDTVKAGEIILEDKKNPGVFYTSPAGGVIASVNRGDKRRFLSIEIDIGKNEEFVEFEVDKTNLKELIIKSGLWPAFRTRPFNRTPSIESQPNAVFINACDSSPLSIDPYEIITHDEDNFEKGLETIKKIFDCDINLVYQNDNFNTCLDGINYHQFIGPHPAGLSGTHISQIYPVSMDRIAWTINFQDLISIGYLINNKKIRTNKLIALAGPSVYEPSLLITRMGANLDELTAGKISDKCRIVSGSVINGHESEGVMKYLGFYDSLVSVIPDEGNDVFLNWLMPGSNLHSKLNVFTSSMVKPSKYKFNTSINGGDRAIVPVPSYEEVIPQNILVTQLLKALVVSDIEMAVDLGMLELVDEDLALCSYVCPSKYDYSSILMDNLNTLYLEQ